MDKPATPSEKRLGGFLGGLTPADFLKDYWQKRPLLIRKALPGFASPISPDELAGLACEAEVESRLILEKDGPSPWRVEHGPFDEERFGTLPETHWTLLVQECNKYVPELAELLERFDFLPQWRVDDVMVSYAPEHGSVGPHTDQYDVFLLQGYGTRRWQISTEPVREDNVLPSLDLRIMRHFDASEEWIVEPGDMLYLPPGVAHYGVALEDCLTLSVGFRAPSHAELITSFSDAVASRLKNEQRYSDPDLRLQQHPGEISADALAQVRDILRTAVADDVAIQRWFGGYVTEAKSGQPVADAVEAAEDELDADTFQAMFKAGGLLERNDWARFAFITQPQQTLLFVDGETYSLKPELNFAAARLCDQRRYPYAELAPALQHADFRQLLTELYNAGYFDFAETGIRIQQVTWHEAEAQLRALRTVVFINEQHVPAELEWDGLDEDCAHLLARDDEGRPIGTVRLLADGHIGRMAVLPEWRGKGIGNALLHAVLNVARKRRMSAVKLDAQTHAVGFYQRHGFASAGEVFMDAGIPHQHMTLKLKVEPETVETGDEAMTGETARKLGEASDSLFLETRDQQRDTALHMVSQARRSVHLFTRNLDPTLYDNEPFIEAIKQLAIATPNTKIYILMQDPRDVIQHGHRIVELARRLSSHIFIHRAADEDQERLDSFLIVDEVGVMRRPHSDRFEGSADYYAPGEARQLLKFFNEAWERSQPEPELRRLHL
jgi:50S ribosomal protein L16 3-hydroxylase